MSQSDPTDNALAAIARILDQPPVIAREQERYAVEEMPAAAPLLESPSPFEAPPSIEAPPREGSPLAARSLRSVSNGRSARTTATIMSMRALASIQHLSLPDR